MLKDINWDKVKATAIKISFIVVLNVALWVYLIGSMVPYGKVGEFKLSWIDYLRLSEKVEWYHIVWLYVGIAVGIILTILFIKWWIEAPRKERDKQEMKAANEANTNRIIEALSKREQKEQRELNKFLGMDITNDKDNQSNY